MCSEARVRLGTGEIKTRSCPRDRFVLSTEPSSSRATVSGAPIREACPSATYLRMLRILRPLGLLHKSLSLATYSTVAKMPQSGNDTDEYSEGEFAGLTEEDFDKLDAISYPKKPLVRAASCTTDEFSDGGFGTLTEQDFEILDAAAAVSLSSSSSKADLATPEVQITYDSDDLPDMKIPERSPFQRFRKSKRLSVTDLVSPAW